MKSQMIPEGSAVHIARLRLLADEYVKAADIFLFNLADSPGNITGLWNSAENAKRLASASKALKQHIIRRWRHGQTPKETGRINRT